MITLGFVRSFVAVVETGSFHAAAHRLGLTQPAITQHVRKLESELGVPLIRRARTACEPTTNGVLFLPIARGLLRLAERARDAVRGARLVIGASNNIGTYYLQPLIRSFTEAGAAIEIDVVLGTNPEIATKLEGGEIDIALMEWWDDRPGFQSEVWRREPLVAIVPPTHPWARKKTITLTKLLSEPLIGGEPGTGTATLLRQVLGPAKADLQVSLTLGNTEAVKRAVAAGNGISLALHGTVADEMRQDRLRAIPIAGMQPVKSFHVVTPENAPPTSPALHFRAHLLQSVSASQPHQGDEP